MSEIAITIVATLALVLALALAIYLLTLYLHAVEKAKPSAELTNSQAIDTADLVQPEAGRVLTPSRHRERTPGLYCPDNASLRSRYGLKESARNLNSAAGEYYSLTAQVAQKAKQEADSKSWWKW